MQSIKYLGVFIDSTRTWKDHISNFLRNYQDDWNNIQIKSHFF